MSQSSLWNLLKDAAEAEGLVLFDVDLPASSGSGTFRVFITRPASESAAPVVQKTDESAGESEGDGRRPGVSLDDCARVSRRILDIDEQQGIIPENCSLEVSSPGINRKLRLPEHFSGAVGERVKVKVRGEKNSTRVVTGVIKSVTGGSVEIAAEAPAGMTVVDINDVKEARVDFRFE